MTHSELANDRTFLAGFRTAIALRVGVRDLELCSIVSEGSGGVSDDALYTGVGVTTVLCGAAVVVVGQVQHARVWHHLNPESADSAPRWSCSMTLAAVVGSLVLSTLLIVTT